MRWKVRLSVERLFLGKYTDLDPRTPRAYYPAFLFTARVEAPDNKQAQRQAMTAVKRIYPKTRCRTLWVRKVK